ncbi:PP2C family protein-serine/threonine phosphatase [Gimesia panareensis]|uniref:PP2C family protein-serine/threonine phosphatase n=1 Tax=Gimesia panareensis TaxID=2527978 RepID=UPI00118C52B9|nr:PP2C family protein-serine/threonine phosphatase [Gimesia panareensis]QDU47720.1 Phosphoserine phosphatase RsbU [Gimesia panareensis]
MTKQSQKMECMEVWGGNQPVDRELTTTGLDIWVYSKPYAASSSGGDVYYVSSCSSGRITRLLLADVSGHGEAVAGRAEVLRQLMRRHINHINHASLVDAINNDFEAESKRGAFATAVIGTYFSPSRTLTLINAGHPSPLIYHESTGNWSPQELDSESGDSRNFPLGVQADQNYSSIKCGLQMGDLVLCFTDGLLEMKRSDGSMLGKAGLLEMLAKLDPGNPSQLITQLVQLLDPHDRLIGSNDDLSIVLFRRNNQVSSIADNVLAPFRAAKHLLQRFHSSE